MTKSPIENFVHNTRAVNIKKFLKYLQLDISCINFQTNPNNLLYSIIALVATLEVSERNRFFDQINRIEKMVSQNGHKALLKEISSKKILRYQNEIYDFTTMAIVEEGDNFKVAEKKASKTPVYYLESLAGDFEFTTMPEDHVLEVFIEELHFEAHDGQGGRRIENTSTQSFASSKQSDYQSGGFLYQLCEIHDAGQRHRMLE